MFWKRLVPFGLIEDTGDQLRTDLDADEVKAAPKVSAHIEPAGEDLEALRSHYGDDAID